MRCYFNGASQLPASGFTSLLPSTSELHLEELKPKPRMLRIPDLKNHSLALSQAPGDVDCPATALP